MMHPKEGKWNFSFSEDRTGYITLRIEVQKHLCTSLIDIDIHPTYISVVIKAKVLRLLLPAEVKCDESTAQRSNATGHLLVSMPKCNPGISTFFNKTSGAIEKNTNKKCVSKKERIGQELINEANALPSRPVRIEGLLKESTRSGENKTTMLDSHSQHLQQVKTKVIAKPGLPQDGPPPLM